MATTSEDAAPASGIGLGVADEEHREVEGLVPRRQLLAVGDPRPQVGSTTGDELVGHEVEHVVGRAEHTGGCQVVAERAGGRACDVERTLRHDLHLLAQDGEVPGVGDSPFGRVAVGAGERVEQLILGGDAVGRRALAPVAAGPSASGIDAIVARIGRSRSGSSRHTVA